MPEFSDEKHQAFSRKMMDILNSSALNLAMAVGYRTGLFDVMSEMDVPRTVAHIARQSGLDARYIREWLGVMCAGGIVELTVTQAEPQYFLPKEHAAFLTRNSGNNNMAVYTQEIPLLTTCALEPVIEAFYTGQGVPYSRYPNFQAFMSELADAKHRQVLVNLFLPSVDNGTLVKRLQKGIRVCDLGCGEGVALLLMARAFPESCFTGMDMNPAVIEIARQAAEKQNLTNAEFMVRDAALLSATSEFRESFDYITAFDAIHDQTRPLDALRSVYYMLAPDGLFSMVDINAGSEHADNIDHPMGTFLYAISLMHCMAVGLVDGGTGLGMMWGRKKAVEMLRHAGFDNVELLEMAHDTFNIHYLCRKDKGAVRNQ